ncbi:MAG: hypothetical protein JXA11_15305 [Phycisphaerae bacterium]|nr:hypothetical protein [Phycisphaerae bacterium]
MAVGGTGQDERFVRGENVQRYKIKKIQFAALRRTDIDITADYDNQFTYPLQSIPCDIEHTVPTETPTLEPYSTGSGSMKKEKRSIPLKYILYI